MSWCPSICQQGGGTSTGHQGGSILLPVCVVLEEEEDAIGFASNLAVSLCDSLPAAGRNHAPRILLSLRSAAAAQWPRQNSTIVAAESCIDLRLPGCSQQPADSDAVWLIAEPLSCNDAARALWRIGDPYGIPSLSELKTDPMFLAVLSSVAMSVSAPQGMRPHQPVQSAVYRPRPQHTQLVPGECAAIRAVRLPPAYRYFEADGAMRLAPSPMESLFSNAGGGVIKVSSSFVRDPADGTLSPALVLELDGIVLEQVGGLGGTWEYKASPTGSMDSALNAAHATPYFRSGTCAHAQELHRHEGRRTETY